LLYINPLHNNKKERQQNDSPLHQKKKEREVAKATAERIDLPVAEIR
jgi:hypothetical protein